eukprot:TRINITY_DN39558_c0_g1_i1.p1 TRINITY_DN39558_c0_g1~~TRINITY_DN39558_c0_g1_i1.p1  ORF type:complete len:486 (+),score=140.66 TRINITY_DN39558_c0_g1_i1:70-1527(+)
MSAPMRPQMAVQILRRNFSRCRVAGLSAAGRGRAWQAPVVLPPMARCSSSSSSSSGGSSTAAPSTSPEGSSARTTVAMVGSMAALAGGLYFALTGVADSPSSSPSAGGGGGGRRTIDLKPMAEEVFDESDNLFVFFLDDPTDLLNRQEDIQRIMRCMAEDPSLHRLHFFYNARREGDPPLPEPKSDSTAAATGDGAAAAAADPSATMKVMMYKGQRKKLIRVSAATPKDQLEDVTTFFTPKSEDLKEMLRKKIDVPRVSGTTFREDVLLASSKEKPILLQMYEDTCFLCFLMRPFINSVAELVKDNGAPFQIKRLNLERNDFPEGCPVARGTPTFVLFCGENAAPAKWDEFKPQDLSEKIAKEFSGMPQEVYEQMELLQNLVSSRMQLFTQVVMWTVELQKLERLCGQASGPAGAASEADPTEDSAFSDIVTELMLKDMKRHDKIRENIEYLRGEVDEVEHDAALVGSILAKSVLAREKAQGILY